MHLGSSTGFRVAAELHLSEEREFTKYFIFINSKQCNKVKDLTVHVKNIFNINEDVNIFIGDVLLPENETIHLIQPSDTLTIKSAPENRDLKVKRFKKEKKSLENKYNESTERLLEELQQKKEMLQANENLGNGDILSQNDSTGGELFFSIPAKKRKRKHKKKTVVQDDSVKNKSDFISFNDRNQKDEDTLSCTSSSSKHIHFQNRDDEEEEVSDHSSPKTTKTNESFLELRERLIDMVKKPLSQKVFSKKGSLSKTDVTENHIVPNRATNDIEMAEPETCIKIPKVGDVIVFKKLKIGDDYTPQKSGEIVGEIMRVEETSNTQLVLFNIKEGAHEFQDPSGKFSIEEYSEELDKPNADKMFMTEMSWNEVLEPRLKTPSISQG